MNRFAALVVAVAVLPFMCGVALAQASPTGQAAGSHMPSGMMSQDQFNKLGEYADTAKRLTKGKDKGKTIEQILAEDKAAAVALTKTMPLNCDVTDAVLAAEGKATIEGKEYDTHTYEAACTNGLGYFLIAVDGGTPYGFSCLAAEATRKADIAAGRQPGTVCKLPPNLDPLAMTKAVLSRINIPCEVNGLNWLGQNSKSKIEYNEASCSGGTGYILISSLPGQTIVPQAINCHDAALRGLICKLTASGPVVTKQTFIDALAEHHVPCSASVDKLHVVGQETAKKRYVVEFVCPEQPTGLVAFIPVADSKAKFETMDCKSAVKRSVVCKLNAQ